MQDCSFLRRSRAPLCLALLLCILFTGFRRAPGADPAPEAAAFDAAVAAIKTVTLKSEDAVTAARAQYEALSPEARALVKNLEALETAEDTLLTLKDRDAAAAIKRLSDAGRFDEAIQLAEDYLDGRALADVRGNAVRNCLIACARKGSDLLRRGEYEAAETWLLACRERYAAVDVSELDRVLTRLSRAVAEPENGAILTNRARGEYGAVTVSAGEKPVLVKLVGAGDRDSQLLFYVRANSRATVRIRDGSYRMRYAVGTKWYGREALFGASTRCFAVETPLQFSTDRTGSSIYSQQYDIDLSAPREGGESAREIVREEF